jgi:hypothetical protein
MKRAYPFVAVASGLAIAIAGAFAIAERTAEAAGAGERFARPAYERARDGAVPDLTRYGVLGDKLKLAALGEDTGVCHDALSAAGVRYREVPAARSTGGCGYDEALVVQASVTSWKSPEAMPMTCDLAAKMHLWERHVVIPAAEKYLGSPVVEIKAFGSFQCRRVSGYARLSEHAYGKAVDIAGFVLADGREITVLGDFYSKGAKGDFLREIHGRACDLFDVTLGPNYNEEHANHFHLDVGGQRACR